MLRNWIALLMLGITANTTTAFASEPAPDCTHDRERLLALDENAFDQDMQGGWRPLSNKPGCEVVAADLIRDYRERHKNTASILFWHEGQLRASAGQSAEAIALMEKARKPEAEDRGGWNPYADATIAFLRKDKPALLAARARLAAVAPPPDQTLDADGFFEIELQDEQKIRMRWPPNIDVVDGLIQCFDKSYDEAYGADCRPTTKQ